MKRDLKADLEELESLKEDDVHFMRIVCFIENNAEKWLEQGVVELERAIKAERLKDVLVKYNKFLVAEVLNKQERSEQLESLVREQENQIDILSTTLAMYCSPYYDMQERAEKAEALARELMHHLDNTACVLASRVKLARKDLIGRTRDGGTQWASDVLGEVKQVVAKAKEVLGDE